MIDLHYPVVEDALTRFIRDFVEKNGFSRGILGVSGGLDSAVTLALTARALGAENTFALLMPYRLSSPESLAHGQLICEKLGISPKVVEITAMVDGYLAENPTENATQVGNLCARARMMALFDYSERTRSLVMGTSNKSELLIGYSTLYGDSAAACLPLGDLYKTQVFGLARHLGIPEEIIQKPPSADLWADQTDEGEIGISYAELDEILFRRVDESRRVRELMDLGYSEKKVRGIEKMMARSQYKRVMPPVAKLQNRTVGIDFRYLRDWKR